MERKLHFKGSEDRVLGRLFVAYPTPRDDKVRAPFIPSAVINRRAKMDVDLSTLRDPVTRKLERELELELGSKYFMDLKKHYILKNPEEKYDIVPEIWEGHNILDFVDLDVVNVGLLIYLKTIFLLLQLH